MYIWILDSWSLCGYIIYSFVGSIVGLCNYCYLDSTRIACMLHMHESLGDVFPKRHHVDCGVIAIICKVPILGCHKEALAEGALGPGAAEGTLGLFLLPARRPGHRFIGADDEATAALIVALFLLSREQPRPCFSTGASMFRRNSPASAMETGVGKKKP
jgi:hypothetical protein